MAKVFLAKRAKKDLIEIRRYTVRSWSKEQAKKYIAQIRSCADELASQQLKGKMREDVAPNVKSYHVGRHVIFYVESKAGIKVARVLHDSMDSQDIFSRDKDMWDLLDRALNIPMLQILLILLYLVILSKILCHLIYEAVH